MARNKRFAFGFATLICLSALGTLGLASAQVPQTPIVASDAAATAKAVKKNTPGPRWESLSRMQQAALAPLSTQWNTLSEGQKRKWLELSRSFDKLSATEKATLHSRMADWAALTPQQRSTARINFAKTQELSAQQKKERWNEYQALSDGEKRKLAASARPVPKTAAPAPKPAPAQKLVKLPPPKGAGAKPARIAAGPDHVNQHTLLPHAQAPDSAK